MNWEYQDAIDFGELFSTFKALHHGPIPEEKNAEREKKRNDKEERNWNRMSRHKQKS
jgi:hypothetical protein